MTLNTTDDDLLSPAEIEQRRAEIESMDRDDALERMCERRARDLPDGTQWWAKDDLGYVLAGPFDAEIEAWRALRGSDFENIGFAEPYPGSEPPDESDMIDGV